MRQQWHVAAGDCGVKSARHSKKGGLEVEKSRGGGWGAGFPAEGPASTKALRWVLLILLDQKTGQCEEEMRLGTGQGRSCRASWAPDGSGFYSQGRGGPLDSSVRESDRICHTCFKRTVSCGVENGLKGAREAAGNKRLRAGLGWWP